LVTQVTIWGVLFGPPAAFAAHADGGGAREMSNILIALLLCALMLWVVIRRTGTRFESMDPATGH